ncbi:uncharacterized protein CEXT_364821 [Caerostris extrusa]|uniref:Uncharacterized protein n=1 Tax=Caerostris extrusa TaxID=172846 RepID=A0AAV4WX18_CAEEX|nr:uncharacterized protein CEXT_364821 [Caerostris extrusa]
MEIEVSLYGLGVLESFKWAAFITCFTIFFYQSGGFYSNYYSYPTTINIAVKPATDFKFPAITFCHNNVYGKKLDDRRDSLCIASIREVSDFLTRYTHAKYRATTENFPKMQFLPSSFQQKEPETRDLVSEAILEKEVTLFYTNFKVLVSETFYPWDTPELLFYIHSPFDPITLLQGKTLRPGFQYSINVDLEEEHLLESPYPTNCTDYNASWKASNKTGPRSQEMCRQTCLKHYSKKCYDCYYGLAMYENSADVCPLRPHVCFVKNRDELWANLQTCVKNCKNKLCVKLEYQYTLVEKPLMHISDRIDLTIYVKDAKVVVLSHKPLYGKWDLFSDIGGLIGCWLGISVWALVGIIESFSYKASKMMHKIKQTPRDPLSSQDKFSLQQQLA